MMELQTAATLHFTPSGTLYLDASTVLLCEKKRIQRTAQIVPEISKDLCSSDFNCDAVESFRSILTRDFRRSVLLSATERLTKMRGDTAREWPEYTCKHSPVLMFQ